MRREGTEGLGIRADCVFVTILAHMIITSARVVCSIE
jgi:hypothetical protein